MSRTPKWDRDARDADGVCRTCGEAGRRTKSAAVRNICERDAAFARDLEAAMVRRLYQQTEVA